ncbi:hypothetical protein [Sanguibacter sp. 25GB23B1]|uniref:hypothetical protein n=1 Tax=unclassified Sanguibacter TaxID=2645534 RepID=UPI0032AF194D
MSGTSPTGSSTAQKGRGLGPGLIAFIVLDVLLVVWAIWLGVSLGSDDPEASGDAEPSPSVSATQTPAPGAEPSAGPEPGTESVASPSGNITCEVSPSGAECGIATLTSEPAPADDCDGVQGYVVSLTSEGVSLPCVSPDELPTAAGAAVEVLDYGQNITVNNFTCDSTESGMTCTDTSTGKGFTLARAGITEF